MSDILCLDTEPETVKALKEAGHNVTPAPFGYRDGIRYLHVAPQDFDLIVCDLRNPACYDERKWGPYGGNDNYKCRVVPREELSWETRLISHRPGSPPVEQYLYHLISETQVERMNPKTPFKPNDIRQAIAVGGVPAVIFLNPEWMLRAGGGFPDFVGLRWETGKTNANKITVTDPLESLVREWEPKLEIATPVRCMLRSGPSVPPGVRQIETLEARQIVIDRVESLLGQVVQCGKSTIWMMPATTNNAQTVCQLAANIAALSGTPIRVAENASDPVPPTPRWDVFISHASEDKPFADELYTALKAHGVKVWYDKSILAIGHSLREKIDEGLAGSRYGVIVLSHDFFKKNWPKAELDAIFSQQMADGKKRVLPIWHNLALADVEKYSPLLASRLASDSSHGITKNVDDILAAIGWSSGRIVDNSSVGINASIQKGNLAHETHDKPHPARTEPIAMMTPEKAREAYQSAIPNRRAEYRLAANQVPRNGSYLIETMRIAQKELRLRLQMASDRVKQMIDSGWTPQDPQSVASVYRDMFGQYNDMNRNSFRDLYDVIDNLHNNGVNFAPGGQNEYSREFGRYQADVSAEFTHDLEFYMASKQPNNQNQTNLNVYGTVNNLQTGGTANVTQYIGFNVPEVLKALETFNASLHSASEPNADKIKETIDRAIEMAKKPDAKGSKITELVSGAGALIRTTGALPTAWNLMAGILTAHTGVHVPLLLSGK